jgi:hypothetical protein
MCIGFSAQKPKPDLSILPEREPFSGIYPHLFRPLHQNKQLNHWQIQSINSPMSEFPFAVIRSHRTGTHFCLVFAFSAFPRKSRPRFHEGIGLVMELLVSESMCLLKNFLLLRRDNHEKGFELRGAFSFNSTFHDSAKHCVDSKIWCSLRPQITVRFRGYMVYTAPNRSF